MKLAEIGIPIDQAKKQFAALKSNYPSLQARIVIATQHGQSEIGSTGVDFLKHVPSIFVPTLETRELHQLFLFLQDLDRRNDYAKSDFITKIISTIRNRVDSLLQQVEILESTRVELRFDDLNHELIRQLKQNPLVDQSLTPIAGASIRIVLGTLGSLSKSDRTKGQHSFPDDGKHIPPQGFFLGSGKDCR